jgi:coenzyme F420-reducing hydrogenase gamma subunit
MQGCDELPRLPEEENKSLENQSSTVVAWGICKVYAIKRIPSAKMNEG